MVSLSNKWRRAVSRIGVMSDGAERGCTRFSVRRLRDGHILVVLVDQGRGCWKVVTAREMTDSERQLYSKATGGR
jgi:hypothetical protein